MGDRVRFLRDQKIGEKSYAIFKTGDGEYRMMERSRCLGIRQDEEVSIFKAMDGRPAGTPSHEALWDRKVDQLSEAYGKEVSFGADIGDRGKYGGEIEFEGKRYGVMHQHDEVKLIDRGDFAEGFDLKKGGYMKIEQYKGDKNEIIAVMDKERYKEIEKNKQQEMQMQIQRSKGRDFEMEM